MHQSIQLSFEEHRRALLKHVAPERRPASVADDVQLVLAKDLDEANLFAHVVQQLRVHPLVSLQEEVNLLQNDTAQVAQLAARSTLSHCAYKVLECFG